jgi:hypothetical protein
MINKALATTRPHTLFGRPFGSRGTLPRPGFLPRWIGSHTRGIAKQGIARERCSLYLKKISNLIDSCMKVYFYLLL